MTLETSQDKQIFELRAVKDDPKAVGVVILKNLIMVGRSVNCDLTINMSGVSNIHAVVEIEKKGAREFTSPGVPIIIAVAKARKRCGWWEEINQSGPSPDVRVQSSSVVHVVNRKPTAPDRQKRVCALDSQSTALRIEIDPKILGKRQPTSR